MKLFREIKRVWSGEAIRKEIDATKKVIEDAKTAIAEARATLDGEDLWMLKHDPKQK